MHFLGRPALNTGPVEPKSFTFETLAESIVCRQAIGFRVATAPEDSHQRVPYQKRPTLCNQLTPYFTRAPQEQYLRSNFKFHNVKCGLNQLSSGKQFKCYLLAFNFGWIPTRWFWEKYENSCPRRQKQGHFFVPRMLKKGCNFAWQDGKPPRLCRCVLISVYWTRKVLPSMSGHTATHNVCDGGLFM